MFFLSELQLAHNLDEKALSSSYQTLIHQDLNLSLLQHLENGFFLSVVPPPYESMVFSKWFQGNQ